MIRKFLRSSRAARKTMASALVLVFAPVIVCAIFFDALLHMLRAGGQRVAENIELTHLEIRRLFHDVNN